MMPGSAPPLPSACSSTTYTHMYIIQHTRNALRKEPMRYGMYRCLVSSHHFCSLFAFLHLSSFLWRFQSAAWHSLEQYFAGASFELATHCEQAKRVPAIARVFPQEKHSSRSFPISLLASLKPPVPMYPAVPLGNAEEEEPPLLLLPKGEGREAPPDIIIPCICIIMSGGMPPPPTGGGRPSKLLDTPEAAQQPCSGTVL